MCFLVWFQDLQYEESTASHAVQESEGKKKS